MYYSVGSKKINIFIDKDIGLFPSVFIGEKVSWGELRQDC
jgi:hypothetical protein